MSASDDALHNLTAQWYNSLTTALSLSPNDFQLAQGELLTPTSTERLWDMMNQIPTESIAQYYTPATTNTFSSDYQSMLSYLHAPAQKAFQDAMGDNYTAWKTAAGAYLSDPNNAAAIKAAGGPAQALLAYFGTWAAINLDPGTAAQCTTLYAASYDSPIYIASLVMMNLKPGAAVPYPETHPQLISDLGQGPSVSFEMDSATASTSLAQSWTSSTSSDGGTYFYSTSSSSEASDFTQKFASSQVTVNTTYQHVLTTQVQALASGTVIEGAATYLPWFYPAALAAAYQDQGSDLWSDTAQWARFFGPDGSLQYVATGLVIVDGVTHTVTSDASYSSAEQTYAHSQSSSSYGCWPYYVSNSSSSTTQTSTSFDDSGHMTVTTTSPVGNPLVIGVLVSPIKDLETALAAAEAAAPADAVQAREPSLAK
jgi:hypothetical protein